MKDAIQTSGTREARVADSRDGRLSVVAVSDRREPMVPQIRRSETAATVIAEMARHRLVPPSDGLKARVLAAAQEAWDAAEDEPADTVSWTPALLRLAASIAATIILICSVNSFGRQSLARWQSPSDEPTPSATTVQADPICQEIPAFAQMARFAAAHPAPPSAEQLLQCRARMRALLREVEGDATERPAAVPGYPQTGVFFDRRAVAAVSDRRNRRCG